MSLQSSCALARAAFIFPVLAPVLALATLTPAPARADAGLCTDGAFVALADGTLGKVQLVTGDGLCQVITFRSVVEFVPPETLTASDEASYKAARKAHKDAQKAAAATATHTAGQPPTACTIGLSITDQNGTPGTITGGTGQVCTVDRGGDITALFLDQMVVTDGAPAAAAPRDGIAALTTGTWTCAAAGLDPFDLALAPGTYATMAGESGALLPYDGDPLAVRFEGGPYDGQFGTVTGGMLFFAPPGGENLTCRPAG